MSFGFGVGDIVLVMQTIFQVYKACVDAPEEIQNTVKSLRVTKTSVLNLQEQLDIRFKLLPPREDVKQILTEVLRDLKVDLESIARLIKKWPKPPSFASVCFLCFDMKTLKALRSRLDEHDNYISKCMLGLKEQADNQNLKYWNEFHAEKAERAKEFREADEVHAKRDKKLYQWIQKYNEASLTDAALDKKTWNKLTNDLVKSTNDTSKANAKEILAPMQQHMKNAGKILCVDTTNWIRSIMTQTYLELVRAWTVNTTGHWLFNCCNSAGYGLDNDFTRCAVASKKLDMKLKTQNESPRKVFDLFTARSSYFATNDEPNEKGEIIARVREHKARGVHARDFFDYQYILCFDDEGYNSLLKLQAFAKTQSPDRTSCVSQIIQLKVPKNDDLNVVLEKMRREVKQFLKNELRWSRPKKGADITDGPSRTRQFSVPTVQATVAWRKRATVRTKSGCEIKVANGHRRKESLVSIIGPREALAEAEKLVRECSVLLPYSCGLKI